MPKTRNKNGINTEPSAIVDWTALLVVAFVIMSVLSFIYFFYFGRDLYSWWFFRVSDPAWLPGGIAPTPILGPHTFGDFQLPYHLALGDFAFATNYSVIPPTGLIYYQLNSIFGIKLATLLHLLLTLLAMYGSAQVVQELLLKQPKKTLSLIVTLFSLPTWNELDRGGVHAIAIFLLLKGVHKLKFEKISGNLFIAIGISLKIYLIVPFLLLCYIFKIRKWITAISMLASSNLFLSFFYPGGPIGVIKGLLKGYSNEITNDPGWLYSGVSFSKLLVSLYSWTHTPQEASDFISKYIPFALMPGLIYIFVIFSFFICSKKIELGVKFCFALSTIFLIVPVSMFYTLIAANLILLITINRLNEAKLERREKLVYLSLYLSALISVLPKPFWRHLEMIPITWLINLILISIISRPKFFSNANK